MDGLTTSEASHRLEQHGRNEILRATPTPAIRLLVRQLASPVIWLLAAAAVVSAVLGELIDAGAIGSIVLVNALVGFFQEYRAERAIFALRALTAPRARVLRDGRAHVIAASDVVEGDLLILEAGDIVSADARLVEANTLLTNEAALTGESTPVSKSLEEVATTAPLAERHDHVWSGTSVANGTGRAVVVATGMRTELGRIAQLLNTPTDDTTPLQRRLAHVGRVLLVVCVGLVVSVAVLGLLRDQSWLEVLLSSVALAVAAVPEGLPAVVTIALAIGVQRMVSRHVLVRRLPAVETLGCTTVICTDKTGTLTTGQMRVREVWGADHAGVIAAAAACCDAEIDARGPHGTGDPTEIAILLAARERGLERDALERDRPRIHTNPFDAQRRLMSVRRADGVLYVKGALESTLPLCRELPEHVTESHAEMAARGLRVLAVAVGAGDDESELRLLGLLGIADPPRTEAIAAVVAARTAGIRTVMITGDHVSTAQAVARELGILGPGDDPSEVVHARATPERKLEIVRDWKHRGAVVAMTGDGVNDAPALREADVGIAMGQAGTEVTREVADVVLTDDDFASIVEGIREGRGIFDNIRKTLTYLLGGNASELLIMLGAAVMGLPLPLLPLHLLWINLVTETMPALALVTDPVDPATMSQPPRDPNESLLGRRQWMTIGTSALLLATVVLGVYLWALQHRNLADARNLAFSVLVFAELFRAFAARSPTRLFWEVGAFTNVRLLGIVVLSVLVQIGIHHIPATQALFGIEDLSLFDCGLGLGLGLIPVTVIELSKLVRRAWQHGLPRS